MNTKDNSQPDNSPKPSAGGSEEKVRVKVDITAPNWEDQILEALNQAVLAEVRKKG